MKYSRSYSRTELRRTGPKIKVTVGHPQKTIDLAKRSNIALNDPYTVTALIDTGAARTVISPQLAKTCGLQKTGSARISSAGHITDRLEFVGDPLPRPRTT